MHIQNLIIAKRKQIELLERHIRMLEQMAAEEAGLSTTPSSRGAAAPQLRSRALTRRSARAGTSRARMIEAYLREHSGPQPATEIAAALGLKPAHVHGAVRLGLKAGRIVRGKGRGTYGLGVAKESSAKPRDRGGKRTRKTRSQRRASKGRTTAPAAQPAPERT